MPTDTRPVFSVATRLIEHAASLYGVEPWRVVRKGRRRDLHMARFAVIWALRQLKDDRPSTDANGVERASQTPYSYTRLARLLGFDDHTSVWHGYQRAIELRETDQDFRKLTNELVITAVTSGPQVQQAA